MMLSGQKWRNASGYGLFLDLSSQPETYKEHCHNYIHVTFNQRGLDATRVNLGDSKELVKLTQPVRNTTVLPVSSRKLLTKYAGHTRGRENKIWIFYPVRGHAQVIRRRGKQAGGERAKEQEHETTQRTKRGRPSSSRGKNSTVWGRWTTGWLVNSAQVMLMTASFRKWCQLNLKFHQVHHKFFCSCFIFKAFDQNHINQRDRIHF